MRREWFLIILMGSVLASCQSLTKTRPLPVSSSSRWFGPVVTPVDGFFRTLAVTYQTPSLEKTALTFTMTGNIDWYLERSNFTTTHHVLFEDVEEETSYTFLPKNFPSNAMTTIATAPFSKHIPVTFAIMRVDTVWRQKSYPAFTILIKDSSQPSETKFREFCESNQVLIHRSILCPTFRVSLDGTSLGEEKPWFWFAYGKAIVIVLMSSLPHEPLYLYLSENENMENFIIAVDFDEAQWKNLLPYQQVAHLIPFSSQTESLFITVSHTITTLYSYKK
ncbi:MAG: hypothetical protein N2314_07145 [Brevinematales bacterium]|nr:hypothetical protein [Brevinematales bacterium]